MKVLYLVEFLKEGGIERILHQFVRHFPAHGVSCSVYSYETPTLTGLGKEMKELGGEVYTYKKSPGYDRKLLLDLAKLVRRENISVIHTHDFGPTEYAAPLKLLFPRLRLIHTQHTLHHFIHNRRYRNFLQAASPFYRSITCVSPYVESEMATKCRWLKRKLTTIPNGVDTNFFVPKMRVASAKVRIVNISRISPEKNLVTLLKACGRLANQGLDFELHHIGSGEKAEEEKIRRAIGELGIASHVTLHGFQTDVRSYLQASDLFVSSSLTEGHPVSVLEAMAAEVPCLLSDIPPHQIFESSGIRRFENTPERLAADLGELIKSRPGFLQRSSENREYVVKNFSIDAMLESYSKIYGMA